MSKFVVELFKKAFIPTKNVNQIVQPSSNIQAPPLEENGISQIFPSGTEQLKRMYEDSQNREKNYTKFKLKVEKLPDTNPKKAELIKFIMQIEDPATLAISLNEAKDNFIDNAKNALQNNLQSKKVKEICGDTITYGNKKEYRDVISTLPTDERKKLKSQRKELQDTIVKGSKLRGTTEDNCIRYQNHKNKVISHKTEL